MKNYLLIALLSLFLVSNAFAQNQDATEQSADTIKDFREFKVLDSKYINNEALWVPFNADLKDFSEASYLSLIHI